jgi:hypothetical protein
MTPHNHWVVPPQRGECCRKGRASGKNTIEGELVFFIESATVS